MSTELLAENLVARLEELSARHAELERQMATPEVASDHLRLVKLSKERGRLDKLVESYHNYRQAAEALEETSQIADSEDPDPDLLQLAQEELPQLETQLTQTAEQVRQALITDEQLDVDSCIIEVRAGTGGGEAALFARDLYQMYTHYAESQSWKTELIQFSVCLPP